MVIIVTVGFRPQRLFKLWGLAFVGEGSSMFRASGP